MIINGRLVPAMKRIKMEARQISTANDGSLLLSHGSLLP